MIKIKEKTKEEVREIAEAIRKTLKEREWLKEILKGWGPDLCPRGVQDIYLGPTTNTTTTVHEHHLFPVFLFISLNFIFTFVESSIYLFYFNMKKEK